MKITKYGDEVAIILKRDDILKAQAYAPQRSIKGFYVMMDKMPPLQFQLELERIKNSE